MKRGNNQVDSNQAELLSRLLINFSSKTTSLVLKRFDWASQTMIRNELARLDASGVRADDQTLQDFADFLYFEPRENETDQQPLKALNSRADLDGGLIRDSLAPAEPAGLTFRDILELDDQNLDHLLKTAPPEMTISVLTCCPRSFQQRVINRLSATDARLVRQKIAETQQVEMEEMNSIHQRFCDFATNVIIHGDPGG